MKLFNDVYINREQWKKKITPEFLKKKVKQICKSFSTWPQEDYSKKLSKIELEEFLLKHENIFQLVDEQKRRRSEEIPTRTELNGKEIYPERGDMEIMRDAASLASLPLQEILLANSTRVLHNNISAWISNTCLRGIKIVKLPLLDGTSFIRVNAAKETG